jgi:beta-phosphoglucomutase
LEHANRPFSNKERVGIATKKNVRYRELLATLSKKDLAKDHRARLKKLKDLGYKLAIGSSSKNASFIVDRLGLTDLIDHIADGNEISRSKPDPEVFLLAAKKMDLPPEACVVIEDAAAGLEAAVAGRFTAAGFGAAAKDELAELSFDNLDQLFDWFLDEAKGD